MKKLQRTLCVMLSVLLLTGVTFSVGAVEKTSEEENTTEHQTMGEIEKEVIEYLKEYHPEITFGTEEYVEYLTEQLLDASDEQLKSRKDYDEICTYATKYLTLVDEKQVVYSEAKDVLTLSTDEKNITLDQIEEEDKKEEAKAEQNDGIVLQNNVQRASNYNASKAVEYARKWADGRNTEYSRWMKDCTNFVSQAVFSGGISMKKPSSIPHGIYKTNKYWYSKKHKYTGSTGLTSTEYDVSNSWIGVEGFYEYVTTHKSTLNPKLIKVYSSEATLQDECKPGDVVQLYNKGGWYHSIIITGGKKGARTYCGHTADRKDYKLSDIKDKNISKYRIIRF